VARSEHENGARAEPRAHLQRDGQGEGGEAGAEAGHEDAVQRETVLWVLRALPRQSSAGLGAMHSHGAAVGRRTHRESRLGSAETDARVCVSARARGPGRQGQK